MQAEENKKLPVIYEDDWLIVVDKPAGLLVIPTPKKEKITLGSLINEKLKSKGTKAKARPCHRLDRTTSGLIIYAKGKKIQQLIMEQFKKGGVEKTYIAFVNGTLKKDKGEIRTFIKDTPFEKERLAITRYKVIERKTDYTVVSISPLTGRTNQIRIHFKQINHPLVGERRFAFARDFKIKFRRPALHASGISFIHPVTGKKISLFCPLPEDMQVFLNTHP